MLDRSSLPFEAPPFDQIHDSDFAPAFDTGLRLHAAEVEAIAHDPAAPSFANTIAALEATGQPLTRALSIFAALSGANTNPELQQLHETYAPRFAAHSDAIQLNPRLFQRVAAVYRDRATLDLDPESRRLLEVVYRQFVMAGAELDPAGQQRLKALNQEEAALSARFMNQLLAATRAGALVVESAAELGGLTEPAIAAAAAAATARGMAGKFLLPLHNTTQQPGLNDLQSRSTRAALFQNSWSRAEKGDAHDTRAAILRLAALRAEKAAVLGFPNYAAWRLQDQMARTPAAVASFLDQLVPSAVARAGAEAAELQALVDASGGGFPLAAWDWNLFSEQVRKTRFDLNTAQLRLYFELSRVLHQGVFFAATQLYGITFHPRHDLPVWHPDVRTYEVREADGTHLALFYTDLYKRDNKNGGAWMGSLVGQSRLLGTKPVIYNVANFDPPTPDLPALLSFSDVTTLFHEFGHALHGLFADQQYPTLSGTAVARDFVEFPSQFNEHWALDPAVLRNYAVHYQTGEPLPAALAQKLKDSATFNQGYALTEILAATQLDLQWHSLAPGAAITDVAGFEATALRPTRLDLPQVPPRYRSSYFLHIWANGYAAGYYAYLWAEMLDDDAFAWFEEHGGLTRANGQHLRDTVLARGNTEEYAKMYRTFAGRDPEIAPLLRRRGLTPTR